ncbi:MAG TPA: hypothetical protein VHB98_03570 [Chloroflexota bacterium]|jgi:hypothetical protein|nr:hypothetical protein [Chloroflexota bacterium]
MSMITPPPRENRIVTTAREAGAGAAVTIIAVVALYLVAQLAIAAVITIAAVLAIGAVLWLLFRRGR